MIHSQNGFDPYAELGVAKDATTSEVRRSYRRRAKKVHPDAGGSLAEFERTHRAMTVLADPARREKFDRTGILEEDAPDNARGNAIQIIERFLGGVLDAYIKTMQGDPRLRDLMKEFAEGIEKEIAGLRAKIATGREVQKFVRDMAGRFSTAEALDPIGGGFDVKLREIETSIAAMEAGIECRKIAIEIAAAYRFRMDAAPFYNAPFPGQPAWPG